MAKASCQMPWAAELRAPFVTAPVTWERVEQQSTVWEHDIVWCPCPGGEVAVHRFTPLEEPLDAAERRSIVLQEMERMEGDTAESASNVGGFHGQRDLWDRASMQESLLPYVIGEAAQQAAQQEAMMLGRPPISLRPDEAWVNALAPGGWNQLHTHAGSAFSGVLFISGGGCVDGDDPLAGRLAFFTNAAYDYPAGRFVAAPGSSNSSHGAALSEEQRMHVRELLAGGERPLGSEVPCLLIDPTPGVCIVFPSWVAHFVFPTPGLGLATSSSQSAAQECDSAGSHGLGRELGQHLRLSIAFNYGTSDPVTAHVFTVRAGGGAARVRLVLELDMFM